MSANAERKSVTATAGGPSGKRSYAALLKAIEAANAECVGRAVTAVNQALVLRNWLVGAYIVEYEQGGADRARYGARLLERLAEDLAGRGLKALNLTLLKLCRSVYQVYPQIGSTLSDRFGTAQGLVRIGPTLSDESSLGPRKRGRVRAEGRPRSPPSSCWGSPGASWSSCSRSTTPGSGPSSRTSA